MLHMEAGGRGGGWEGAVRALAGFARVLTRCRAAAAGAPQEGGGLKVRLEGRDVEARLGVHFWHSAADMADAKAGK